MEDLIVRRYEPEDKDQVVELWRQCSLIVPQNDPKRDIELKIRLQPELLLVGEINGRVIATVMVGYDGHRGWIDYLAVSPSLRRRGIGTGHYESCGGATQSAGLS
ncbi:MAG: GNAT family N-acetyltransferase [Armatimonadota bacterium]